jgi:hypothetical protein
MKRAWLSHTSVLVILFTLNASISYQDEASSAKKLQSWVTKHPYVSVLLKDGTRTEGKLKVAGETSCIVEEDKSEKEIQYLEISDVNKIRGPDAELAGTIAVLGALLLVTAWFYATSLK